MINRNPGYIARVATSHQMDSKENSSTVSNKVDERRRMLEEYLQAKKAKKDLGKQPLPKHLKQSVHVTDTSVKVSQPTVAPLESSQVEERHLEIDSTEIKVHHDNSLDVQEPNVIPESTEIKIHYDNSLDIQESDVIPESTEINVHQDNSFDVQEPNVIPKSGSVPVETCTIPAVETIAIDWNRPVYLKTISGFARVQRPHLRLFRLGQVEAAIGMGLNLLATIMLQVLGAPRQCRRFDARFSIHFWKLYKDLHAEEDPSEIRNAAKSFLPTKLLDNLFPNARPCSTPKKSCLSEPNTPTTPNTPVTPEITLPAPNVLQTPDDDEETKRMQAEIDQVVRRTPQIQKITPPRPIVLQRALTAIKDTSLYKTAPNASKIDGNLVEEGGSAYLYAMITPSKKIRELLETNAAVSPVRRSKRLISLHSPNNNLYSRLDEIPNLAECGFIPNNAVNDGEMSDQRRLAVKQDYNSTHGTPSKKRSKTETKEGEAQSNPFE